jgi:arsenate reductase
MTAPTRAVRSVWQLAELPRILFVDPDHGPRSQMAEALLRSAAADRYDIGSAGTDPTGSLEGVEYVLREVGIPEFVPAQRAIASVLSPHPDLLVTVCEEGCGSCPYVPGSQRVVRWPQPDPALAPPDQRVGVLRRIRDDLQLRVSTLLNLPPP